MLVALECIRWLNSIGRYSWRHTMCKGPTAGVCTESLRPQKKKKTLPQLIPHVTWHKPQRLIKNFRRRWRCSSSLSRRCSAQNVSSLSSQVVYLLSPSLSTAFTAASVTPAPTEKAGRRSSKRHITKIFMYIDAPCEGSATIFFFVCHCVAEPECSLWMNSVSC